MIVAFAALSAASLASLVVVILAALRLDRSHQQERAEWRDERRELLNRIQRPEVLPSGPDERFEAPHREPDEWARVGEITIDPEYGLEDEGR